MIRRDFLTLGLSSLASVALPERQHPVPATGPSDRGSAAIPPLQSRMADDVCESYMINTKIFYTDSTYEHTDAVVDLLQELGVRIVRERITTSRTNGTRNQQRAMLRLAQAGIRWHGTVGELGDWADADAVNRDVMRHLVSVYKPRVGGDLSTLMHSFGGCNEIDGSKLDGRRDPQWAAHARIMQRALWAAAKADRATRDIPVAGPSTRTDITAHRAAQLGDLSTCSEWGNAHMYNRGTSPTRYLDEHITILRRCFPDARNWVFTESGYSNSPQDNRGRTIPEEAAAIYAPRAICDFFRRHAIWGRFELLDDPDPIDYSTQTSINRTALREAHMGLVAMTRDTVRAASPRTWRKKPEFHATRRFLRLMSDRGPRFTTDALRIAITGGGPDLQQALVQKRDGRHYLLLWRDVEVSTRYPDASPVHVRPVHVQVAMGTHRPTAVYVPNWHERPIATYSARSSITVPVGKSLRVVEIG